MDSKELLEKYKQERQKIVNQADKIAQQKINMSNFQDEQQKLLRESLEKIIDLQAENVTLRQIMEGQNNQLYPEGYVSTTQFWKDSLAKNLYNMNGNSLGTNSYLYVRQLLGIVNGAATQTDNKTLQQPMEGLLNSQMNPNQNTNGSGVGLIAENNRIQGWWLWIFILERFDYFVNLVKWKTDDLNLKKALTKYSFNVVCAGIGGIQRRKVGEKYLYKSFAIDDLRLNDWDEPVDAVHIYDSQMIMRTQSADTEPENLETIDLNSDDVVYGKWRTNGYSIWFYIMGYLFQGIDMLFIFWNKVRMTQTMIFQKKSDSASASNEAEVIMNPYAPVKPINTAGYSNDNNQGGLTYANRYEVVEVGDAKNNEYMFHNFVDWMSYWDSCIGIRTLDAHQGEARSISDEVQPLNIRISKLQQSYIDELDNLKLMIKEKWDIEVDYEFDDEIILSEMSRENPAFKKEGGNESEQNNNNGEIS